MLRVISQTILGLILLVAGGYLTLFFLQRLADGTGTWAIFCAIPMLISALILLVRAGKSDATVMNKIKIPQLGENITKGDESFANRLKKDNAMMKEWNQTNDARDRLRMLELGADTGKENS